MLFIAEHLVHIELSYAGNAGTNRSELAELLEMIDSQRKEMA